MRTALKLALTFSLITASAAHATSFANRGLGLGIGYMRIFSDDSTVPDFAIPLWLEGSYYAESGFDVYVRIPLALALPGDIIGVPGDDGWMALWIALPGGRALGYHASSDVACIIQPTLTDCIVWRSLDG